MDDLYSRKDAAAKILACLKLPEALFCPYKLFIPTPNKFSLSNYGEELRTGKNAPAQTRYIYMAFTSGGRIQVNSASHCVEKISGDFNFPCRDCY